MGDHGVWQPDGTDVPAPLVEDMECIALPAPRLQGQVSVEETLAKRRSRRRFRDSPLTLEQVAQILWAAQGITHRGGLRAAPSAGALYPLDFYAVVGPQAVQGLEEGAYQYLPRDHALRRTLDRDVRQVLAHCSWKQMFIADAPFVLVMTAEYERTTRKYGDRGVHYVHMDVGHAAQNVYLQAEALGLATVAVGAFVDDEISRILDLPSSYRPLYLMPIGYPAPSR